MNKNIKNILIALFILIALLLTFWWGGNSSGLKGFDVKEQKSQETEIVKIPKNKISKENIKSNEKAKTDTEVKNENLDKYETEPTPKDKPTPIEPENSNITKTELGCYLSVSCETIFNNIDDFKSEKKEILPKDGQIFKKTKVVFYEGESVFNVLLREMKKNKIPFEFVNTPIYNSAYIEGINNIYEFDCGELSGWMYSVNDWFPNYGPSRYQLKINDDIKIIYTCTLGKDIGGDYITNKQRDE